MSATLDEPLFSVATALATACADLGHPGATYNPWLDQTWCRCGAHTYDGNTAVQCVSCCDGPLAQTQRRGGR